MTNTASFSPSMSPIASQRDEILLSRDPCFALHGEIMMLILITLFIIFLISIVFFLWIKRPYDIAKLSQMDLMEPENAPFPIFYHGDTNSALKSLHPSEDCT